MIACDVLVVGAGIAGTSVAFELQAYADVILLELEEGPGDHAAGRATAIFAASRGNRLIRAMTGASRRFYQEQLAGLVDRPVLGRRGALTIARDDQAERLEAFYNACRPFAPALEPLQADAVLARVPELRPGYARGGLYDPDVHDLDAALVHAGYLRGFQRRGGRLITAADPVAVAGVPAAWEVRTRAGSLATPMIVDAAGARADEVASLVGAPPLGLQSNRRTAFLFEPSIDLAPDRPLVVDTDRAFSFAPDAGLVRAASAEAAPQSPADLGPRARDVALVNERIERATRLRVERVVRRWAEVSTSAPDGAPVVGMDERMPGFFWLAGQGGYGIQTAPALARAGAALLVDGVVPDDLLDRGVTADDLMPLRLRSPEGGEAPG